MRDDIEKLVFIIKKMRKEIRASIEAGSDYVMDLEDTEKWHNDLGVVQTIMCLMRDREEENGN